MRRTSWLITVLASYHGLAPEPALGLAPEPALRHRIRGFYPFPGGPRGPIAWLLRDTHQAIVITDGSDRVFLDFMTEGGAAHPVWWDERVKWEVLLGRSIRGEVRLRNSGVRGAPGSKLNRLREKAAGYDRNMSLYTNNCRVFCARMEREVARLNAEPAAAADRRLAFAVLRAGLLPALYPASVLWLCWVGLRDAPGLS